MMHMGQWMNWIHILRPLRGKKSNKFLNFITRPSLIESTAQLVYLKTSQLLKGNVIYYRFDVDSMNGLPDHCKMCYSTSLNVFSEFDEEIVKQGSYYDVSYLKEAVCTLQI